MRQLLVACMTVLVLTGCGRGPVNDLDSFLGNVEEQLREYDFGAARAAIDDYAGSHPEAAAVHYAEGLLYEYLWQDFDALHAYMQAVNSDMFFAPAQAGVSRMYYRLGHYEESALAATAHAAALRNDPEAQLAMARACSRIGQAGLCERAAAAALDSGRTEASFIRAAAVYLDHAFDSANVLRERAMANISESPSELAAAAEMYAVAGMLDSAIALGAAEVDKSGEAPLVIKEQFLRALDAGCFHEARRMMALARERGCGDTVRYLMETAYYVGSGNRSKAVRLSGQVRALVGETVTAQITDAFIHGASGDLMSVMQDLRVIMKRIRDGNYLEEYYDFVLYYLAIEQTDLMLAEDQLNWLRLVRGLRANRPEVRVLMARLMFLIGDFDNFREEMKKLEKSHPSEPNWLAGLADIYLEPALAEPDQAERLYLLALEKDAHYAPAFEELVELYRNLHRPEAALALFKKHEMLVANTPSLRVLQTIVLIENGKFDEALKVFGSTAPLVSGRALMYDRVLKVVQHSKRPQTVTPIAEIMVDLGGENPDVLTLAARFLSDAGSYQRAAELAERAIEIDGGYNPARVQKARALYRLGETDRAIETLEQLITEERDNIYANYYLARFLADEKRDLQRASNLARQALSNAGTDVEILMNISYVYFQQGRYDLSRGEALKTLRTFPDHPLPHFRAGMAWYMEGKSKEARQELQKALDLGLSGNDREMANQTLAKLK